MSIRITPAQAFHYLSVCFIRNEYPFTEWVDGCGNPIGDVLKLAYDTLKAFVDDGESQYVTYVVWDEPTTDLYSNVVSYPVARSLVIASDDTRYLVDDFYSDLWIAKSDVLEGTA